MELLTVGFTPLMADTGAELFQFQELPENSFRGVASVFGGIVDAYMPTIINRGAFAKTLQEQSRGVKILWQHNPDEPIGVPTSMFETDQGLALQAAISGTQRGQDALLLLRDKVIDGLSIGFDAIKQEFVEQDDGSVIRYIKEVRLWEVSVVTWGADPNARITEVNHHPAIKAFAKQEVNIGKLEMQAVQRYANLPLADRSKEWDSVAAKSRVRDWANADEAPNRKFGQAFVYVADQGENFGDYKLPIGDIVNGTLVAVPRGIFAAAAVVQGARGGVSIPEEDVAAVRRHLASYYRKMRTEFDDPSIVPPWEMSDFHAANFAHYSTEDATWLIGQALMEGLSPEAAIEALALVNEAESQDALTSNPEDDREQMERQLMQAELVMTETFSAVNPL